jgi:hypothetical protein
MSSNEQDVAIFANHPMFVISTGPVDLKSGIAGRLQEEKEATFRKKENNPR